MTLASHSFVSVDAMFDIYNFTVKYLVSSGVATALHALQLEGAPQAREPQEFF